MKAIPLAVLVACGVLSASAAGANQGPPPKPPTPINPAAEHRRSDDAARRAWGRRWCHRVGAWSMRRGTTKPGG